MYMADVDAMNDEHVLNMANEGVQIPDWFTKRENLRIMFASGDFIRDSIPNTQEFSEYDIHSCYIVKDDHYTPVNGYGTDLESNVNYIRENHYHEKLIIILDLYDDAQISRFTELFINSVSEINTLDIRIFQPNCASAAHMIYNVLQPNGIVVRPATQCVSNLITHGFECERRKCTKKTVGGKRKRGKKTQRRRRNLKK
jgi:hypothetical protein